MNRTIRRATTVVGSTVGALALLTGTAAAHYCYSFAPEGTQRAAGSGAWATADETAASLEEFLPEGECRDALIAHVHELGDDGALFMGPGLLAAGAVRQGKGPSSVGHLFEDARGIPACGFLFQE